MRYAFFVFSLVVLIAGCGGGGGGGGPTVPLGPGGAAGSPVPTVSPTVSPTPTHAPTKSPSPSPSPSLAPSSSPTIAPIATPTPTIITKGAFSEYVLPGLVFNNVANGPANTVWFGLCLSKAQFEKMNSATASLTTFTAPSRYAPLGNCQVANIAGNFWFPVNDTLKSAPAIARITPDGGLEFFDVSPPAGGSFASNIVLASDGDLWFTLSRDLFRTVSPGALTSISMSGTPGRTIFLPQAGVCTPAHVPIYFQGNSLVSGADGNLYVAAVARYAFGRCPGGTAIFKISTNGKSITRYDVNSGLDVAVGGDAHIWFVELGGSRLGSMKTDGSTTYYPVPNGPSLDIASATDGGLWFMEPNANEIAHTTTSGAITEYSIPFSGSPFAITACPDPATTMECGPNGGAWFLEAVAGGNEIVRFNKP